MSYTGPIPLTPEEQTLFDKIIFPPDDHDDWLANAAVVPRLMKLMLTRGAIPEHRLEYFNNPEYRTGRMKGSRRDIFERNGTKGLAIFEHANFLKYLRYFVLGVEMPEKVIDEFRHEVERVSPVSGGDMEDLIPLARRLIRGHRIEIHEASDNFFKLCLDCGVSLIWAAHLREAIKKMH
jgi:hypothetical protein